ncbi:unnamed protein product [Owenia fusiformis]|uniref:WAP domain-containing protein n=1 Tax=Owenia fusiformis TaxID=6347 RepID=A0A8S4PWQ0_OWEFU|nr:unnamed protein product [Owenia fusiformis]
MDTSFKMKLIYWELHNAWLVTIASMLLSNGLGVAGVSSGYCPFVPPGTAEYCIGKGIDTKGCTNDTECDEGTKCCFESIYNCKTVCRTSKRHQPRLLGVKLTIELHHEFSLIADKQEYFEYRFRKHLNNHYNLSHRQVLTLDTGVGCCKNTEVSMTVAKSEDITNDDFENRIATLRLHVLLKTFHLHYDGRRWKGLAIRSNDAWGDVYYPTSLTTTTSTSTTITTTLPTTTPTTSTITTTTQRPTTSSPTTTKASTEEPAKLTNNTQTVLAPVVNRTNTVQSSTIKVRETRPDIAGSGTQLKLQLSTLLIPVLSLLVYL